MLKIGSCTMASEFRTNLSSRQSEGCGKVQQKGNGVMGGVGVKEQSVDSTSNSGKGAKMTYGGCHRKSFTAICKKMSNIFT